MHSKPEHIGDKHGRLTIARHAVERGNRFYECVCVCGGSKIASIYDILRGFTRSCGCLHREKSAENGRTPRVGQVKDLSGQRFGRLLVVERGPNNKHACATWLCRCDCGTEKIISGNHLVTGNTASCGCAHRERQAVRPEDKRKKSTEYVKNRYRTDIRYALNRRMLCLVHVSLKNRGSRKSGRLEAMVGYSVDALLSHLKKKIPSGYTWDDFLSGFLQLEHETPLAAFNFEHETDLDFRRAWALENLQLMPGPENLLKGDLVDGQFQPSLCF